MTAIMMAVKERYGIAGGVRAAEFEPLGLGIRRVHRDPDRGGAVSLREGQVDGSFVSRHEAAIGVGGRGGDRQDGAGVLEEAADAVEGHVAETGVLVAGEEGFATLPEGHVGVHAGAVVLEDGLGHEGDGFAVSSGDVLDDVLVPHQLVGHLKRGSELHVDFALTGGGDFVVMGFDDDADLAHLVDHLGSDVAEGVVGTDGEVSAPLKLIL
jgi:hypothetical protein